MAKIQDKRIKKKSFLCRNPNSTNHGLDYLQAFILIFY